MDFIGKRSFKLWSQVRALSLKSHISRNFREVEKKLAYLHMELQVMEIYLHNGLYVEEQQPHDE
ncbi:hypothetical protein HAX54_013516, partial [Datura stramonium]|nr:hypothetical protein [Datura stramonium]